MNINKYPFFSNLNIYFARFISKLANNKSYELYLASALVSLWTEKGNICLDLNTISEKALSKIISDENIFDYKENLICPELSSWVNKLQLSGIVGKAGETAPLILDEKNRLYLYRYYDYEKELSKNLKKRMILNEDIDYNILHKGLEKFFPNDCTDIIDYQRIAAKTALTKRICIISGGPGTGKTTLITKILALLLELNEKDITFALATPTGKAAARLEESIIAAKKDLICSERIKNKIPENASTIHRLLESISYSPYFRYNKNNPLPIDVVVIDEASMVDLALMSKLVQALPENSKIILLGDKDQLASVEAGSVLGDLCNIPQYYKKINSNPIELENCIVFLKKNYRFGDDKSIIKVSKEVNKGNGEIAISIMKKSTDKQIEFFDIFQSNDLMQILSNEISLEYSAYLKTDNINNAFNFFNSFRILCAVKNGNFGVLNINKLVEQILYKKGLIKLEGQWYHGQPIMITRNDYQLNLFNGDTGIIFYDKESRGLRAFFKTGNNFKKIILPALPEHETVFAMTVHKSQGSEFDRIILLLPDIVYPVMTRELVYTGITRAKTNVKIFGSASVFCETVKKKIIRSSGLLDDLFE